MPGEGWRDDIMSYFSLQLLFAITRESLAFSTTRHSPTSVLGVIDSHGGESEMVQSVVTFVKD